LSIVVGYGRTSLTTVCSSLGFSSNSEKYPE
jgi:hypothetical protein